MLKGYWRLGSFWGRGSGKKFEWHGEHRQKEFDSLTGSTQDEVSLAPLTSRIATADDVPGLALVHHISIRETFSGALDDYVAARSLEYCETAWKERFDGNESTTLVLVRDQVIVGFASVAASSDQGEDEEDARNTAGEVARIYLHPKIWGQGHGNRLMQWCHETLRKQGFTLVRLWVFEVNQRACRFYEKHGFSRDGKIKEEYGGVLLRYSKDL